MSSASATQVRLVCALQSHQSTDFALLYKAYSATLYKVLLNLVKESDQAEDLLQDTFIKIWTNHGSYDPQKSSLFTWMVTIARNVALDDLRAAKIRVKALAYMSDCSIGVTYSNVIEGIPHKSLLHPLTPPQQAVFDLIYFKNHTYQEASELLGLPLGTIKTHVHMGLKKLKRFFSQDIGHY